MKKRTRKSPVKPEMRRDWLKRYQDKGETPTEIAREDRFDIRTVRKQIDLAQQEREVRETRSLVLRSALEEHYKDLCHFVSEITSKIVRGDSIGDLKEHRMWMALRQHLPRAPLWKDVDKRDQILEEIPKLREAVKNKLMTELWSDSKLGWAISHYERVIPGIAQTLAHHLESLAQGKRGLNIDNDFKIAPAADGLTDVDFSFAYLGRVPQEHVESIKEVLKNYLSQIINWEERYFLQKHYFELKRLSNNLEDDLTTITLRRIVPGHCKYCPV